MDQGAEQTKFLFGEFRFDTRDKVLYRGDEIVGLPPKTCELLSVLIRKAGNIVTKSELMEMVWPDTFVEEANLSHHITVLRKALSSAGSEESFIQTIPRKGYRFVAPLNVLPGDMACVTMTERRTTETIEEIEVDDQIIPVERQASTPSEPGRRYYLPVLLGIVLAAAGLSAFVWFRSSDQRAAIAAIPATQARLTNSGKVGAASISPDGSLVAYQQNYTEGVGILYIRQTGTNIENRLATHEKGEFGMTGFSPDGAFVYYVVRDADHPEYGLCRIPSLGGTPVRVIEHLPSPHFSLSPDGSEIAVVRNDNSSQSTSVVAIRTDGTAIERTIAVRSLGEISFQNGGTWSPDGRRFVLPVSRASMTGNYSQQLTNIMDLDLQTGRLADITRESWEAIGVMRWMPDGSGVVLIGSRPQLRNQIYFVSIPSGDVSRITHDTQGYGNFGLGITKDGKNLVADVWEFDARLWKVDLNGDPKTAVRFAAGNPNTLSGFTQLPNGRVVFGSRTNFTYDLWSVDESENEARAVTTDPFIDRDVISTPDGNSLIVSSDRAGPGTKHLFRMNADSSQVQQLTAGDRVDESPEISPDGKWIIFQSNEYDSSTGRLAPSIKIMPVSGGEQVTLRIDCFVPSFSPDGRMFACVVPGDNYRGKLLIANLEGDQNERTFDVGYFFHTQLPVRWTPDGKALVYRQMENQVANLWKQPIAGGPPVKLTDFATDNIFAFTFSHDRKHLLLSRGTTRVNVVSFSNFR